MRRDSECYSQEVKEWMEENSGIVVGKGKQRHYKLFNYLHTYCKGCTENDTCDLCGIRLCHYLAKYVDDEHVCPECWCSLGCPIDDRLKEEKEK